jgi:hypothetical protein
VVSPLVFPTTPSALAARQAAELAGDFSERLLGVFLGLCENPRTRQWMLRMVRSSVTSARAGRALYRVLNSTVVNPVARATGVQASALRIELVCGQLVGLAMMRYVLHIEPVASASVEEVVREYSPALRATLRAG